MVFITILWLTKGLNALPRVVSTITDPKPAIVVREFIRLSGPTYTYFRKLSAESEREERATDFYPEWPEKSPK